MKLTADDLLGFGVVDEIVPEPLGGAHRDPARAAASLKEAILRHLRDLLKLSGEELVRDRYTKLKRMGVYEEETARPMVFAGK